MTHPLLDAADVRLGDHPGAERVAQVVEAQRAQTCPLQRGLVAPATAPSRRDSRRPRPANTRSSSPIQCSRRRAARAPRPRRAPSGPRGPCPTSASSADRRRSSPAPGSSLRRSRRRASAAPGARPRRRPGERGGQEQRAVLLGRGGSDERPDLLGREHLDVAARVAADASRPGPADSPAAHTRVCARRKIPCSMTSSLFLLRFERPPSDDRRQRSISSVVTSSSGIDPNAGSRCALERRAVVLAASTACARGPPR